MSRGDAVKQQHTPERWKVAPYKGEDPYNAQIVSNIGPLVPIADIAGHRVGAEANARLIAAAPDLLEALRQVAISVGHGDAKDIATRALAKVRGEQP